MQTETILTGKQRNDWTRSRQGLLALRAYGELVTQFPTNYVTQLNKIKEFYDALVNEESPPKGCTKAQLLCPWRSTTPTEMKGQEILNKALATRLEVRDVIVPAAMKIMIGGKKPSGKRVRYGTRPQQARVASRTCTSQLRASQARAATTGVSPKKNAAGKLLTKLLVAANARHHGECRKSTIHQSQCALFNHQAFYNQNCGCNGFSRSRRPSHVVVE